MNRIGLVSYLVREYDEAVDYFTNILSFSLVEDTLLPEEHKRWVVVEPNGDGGSRVLLARASRPAEIAQVGRQAGGRVAFSLETDDFWGDYERYKCRGVRFREDPREERYGVVAVFEDLYGNRWDLVQPLTPP